MVRDDVLSTKHSVCDVVVRPEEGGWCSTTRHYLN